MVCKRSPSWFNRLIPPLRIDEARALAGSLLDGSLAAVATRCVERAEGNPLFLEQLIRDTAERADSDAIRETVQSLAQARLDRLEPALKQAMQAAAVFGQRFSLSGLRYLLGNRFISVESCWRYRRSRRRWRPNSGAAP